MGTGASEPRVSIVIPTFQRRELVLEAIESVEAQSYRDFELIVVDDGSTDGTGEMVESLGGWDGRLRYRWQPHRGVSAARNLGVELSRARIIAFLDSDNLWLPDHLAVVTELLERFPRAVLATTSTDGPVRPRERSDDEAHPRKQFAEVMLDLGDHSSRWSQEAT